MTRHNHMLIEYLVAIKWCRQAFTYPGPNDSSGLHPAQARRAALGDAKTVKDRE
jgi:hypothetical protein